MEGIEGKSVMEMYEKLEKVGKGTYGKVYRARNRASGKIVAFKKTRLHEDDEGVPPTTLSEVSILLMLSRDPHIVRLMDVKQGHNKEGKTVMYLVFDGTASFTMEMEKSSKPYACLPTVAKMRDYVLNLSSF